MSVSQCNLIACSAQREGQREFQLARPLAAKKKKLLQISIASFVMTGATIVVAQAKPDHSDQVDHAEAG